MLGAVIGDIVGSAYEFRPLKSKRFEPLFHPQAHFTDDTVCTVAVADALVHGSDPAATLQAWCRRYESVGGWGQRFAFWIVDDAPRPYGSWGNGGAMRVSAAGLLARNEEEVMRMVDAVTLITHNHPDALTGARAVALAIHWARAGQDADQMADGLSQRFGYVLNRPLDDIRPGYRRTEKASGSVPEAIACALQSTSVEDALRNAVSLGGDSDTMAAMAGSIAEAMHGMEPALAAQGWGYLPDDMRRVLTDLYRVVPELG